jgi:hypothetical protein
MALPDRINAKGRTEKRIRCPGHLKWIRGFECCVPDCKRRPIEAAHVRTGTNGGMGMKPDDTWAISLCQHHHMEQHRIGEPAFETAYRINLKAVALEFAKASPHRRKWEKAA